MSSQRAQGRNAYKISGGQSEPWREIITLEWILNKSDLCGLKQMRTGPKGDDFVSTATNVRVP